MLKRFEWIHDTAKYGIGGFIAFAFYYLSPAGSNFDPKFALLIMQWLVLLIFVSALNNYWGIYTVGTYIAVVIERGPDAIWHKMSRKYGGYLEYLLNDKMKGKWKAKRWNNWPFPIGNLWGADSAQFAWLGISLIIWSFFTIGIKTGFHCFIPDWNAQWIFLIVIALLLFSINVLLVVRLFTMKDFINRTEARWRLYSQDFGDSYRPYDTPLNAKELGFDELSQNTQPGPNT